MFEIFPIGYVRNDRSELYQVPYQTGLLGNMEAVIELEKGCNYEEALRDLAGMERIWVVFMFHKATGWKPRIKPPRGEGKRGLFATRSPHRPNSVGMSAVKLKRIDGLRLYIEDHDLIDGTPVIDIKPYLPYVDSFPDVRCGWLEEVELPQIFTLKSSPLFDEKNNWLKANGGPDVVSLAEVNLAIHPYPRKGNRIEEVGEGRFLMAIKTWRLSYSIKNNTVYLGDIQSGYEAGYIDGQLISKWNDIDIHRSFLKQFSQKL